MEGRLVRSGMIVLVLVSLSFVSSLTASGPSAAGSAGPLLLPLPPTLVTSGRGMGPLGTGPYYGAYGDLKSLPLFYTNVEAPTYDNLRPVVGYVSHAAVPLGGWMFHGLIFYASELALLRSTQAGCDQWRANLFASPGWLDTLDQVVSDLKVSLGDSTYRFNVFLSVCYSSDMPGGNTINNVQNMINDWNAKHYSHLTLAGFMWGVFESPSQGVGIGAICDVYPTNHYIHGLGLGLKTLWIPYYPEWEDLTTRCPTDGRNWQQWEFDYVTAQPNYAFFCPHDAGRFNVVNTDLQNPLYQLAGVELEIAHANTVNDPVHGTPRCPITIEQNANAYLDAGFQYGWVKNTVNTFFYAPKFISHYADGWAGNPPACPWLPECDVPKTFDRAIYDRIWEFIRGYHTITLAPEADSYVMWYYPDMNRGTDDTLYAGTNAINKFHVYLRWNYLGNIPSYSYVMKATVRLNLREWFYGSSLTDGQFYSVSDDSWSETGITWNNQPGAGSWTLKASSVAFDHTGWYPDGRSNFDVTTEVQAGVLNNDWKVSVMFKRQFEDDFAALEPKFNSREYADVSVRPQLVVEYVSSQTVYQVATEDSYVMSACKPPPEICYADVNRGADTVLILGTNAYPNAIRPYLKFRMDGFEGSSVMFNSFLFLDINAWYYGTDISDGQLFLVTDDSWAEMAITWTNQPAQSTWQSRYSGLSFSSASAAYYFALHTDLTDRKSLGFPASFMLKRSAEDGNLHECAFYSRDNTARLDLRPQILVTLKPY